MSMNSAYADYINDAYDSYPFDNDGDRDIVNQFLNWLQNEYQPTAGNLHGSTEEPTAMDYAKANGWYPTGPFLHTGILASFGIDRNKLTAEQLDKLMTTWTDIIYDQTSMSDAINDAVEQAGLDWDKIRR